MGGMYHPSPLEPYGFAPVQQQFARAVPPAPTIYPGQASTSTNGQYNQSYGRGNGGIYQPRAFFTREHANFIDKLKMKDAIEEARKKDIEEIARLKELSRDSEKNKEKARNDRKAKKQNEKDKGKGKMVEEGKDDEMKRWVADNFGNSLKILMEKLEVVEKKSRLKESEVEELQRLRAEKELRDLRESSSNEKIKRDTASPGQSRVGKVRSRSGLLRRGGKKKTLVEVSSDKEGKYIVVQILKGKLDESGGNLKEVLVLKDLIEELLASKSAAGSSSGGDGGKLKGGDKQAEP
ncbi:hypothetical protein CBR_g17919 [Chara braunii]|uniref:Uncharacterized protein n=1 Tax=Chara braunii TaxID=69332 RepID=A0A388KVX1_CHABU|nr:hypothetical protein CBR_g17919 [Chara braunii]|eukprot:GBG74206.1 hypothetical protein CBR_g17919 [Chara braunii]